MLTGEQFDRTRRLALRLAGIELFERHREVLDRSSRRLGMDSGSAFDGLLEAADEGDPGARQRLIGLVTTNFTGFFRHPWHFDIAAEHALWAVHRRGAARLWSAAAATGEEPYSLAMVVDEVFRRDNPVEPSGSQGLSSAQAEVVLSRSNAMGQGRAEGPSSVISPALPVTIIATDVDETVLARARRGGYDEHALGALEPRRREGFFAETATPGRWRIVPAARDLVEFRVLNLADVVWPLGGPFDVVFCRNVLMYLEAGFRYSVLERVATLLAPDGLLILDPAEHLGRAEHLFAPGASGVHRLRTLHSKP